MAKPQYKYTLEFKDAALKMMELLPKDACRQIGYAVGLWQRDFTGDVKKLKGWQDRCRLRVGNFRVLFRLVKTTLRFTG